MDDWNRDELERRAGEIRREDELNEFGFRLAVVLLGLGAVAVVFGDALVQLAGAIIFLVAPFFLFLLARGGKTA